VTIPAAPARRGLLYAAAVLVVVAVVLGLLAFGRYRSDHALASAPICPAGRATSSCRELVPATIAKVTIKAAGRGPHLYSIRLTGPTAVAGDHRFPTDDGVMATAHEGDPVVGEVWRRSVVAVRDGSVRSLTVDAPRYRDREWFMGALAAVLFALVALLTWRWDVRSLDGYRGAGRYLVMTTLDGWRATIYLAVAVGAAAATLTTFVEAVDPAPLPIEFGIVFGILAVFVALVYRRDYRKLTEPSVRSSTRRSKVPSPRRP
jgi:hypothetical protein